MLVLREMGGNKADRRIQGVYWRAWVQFRPGRLLTECLNIPVWRFTPSNAGWNPGIKCAKPVRRELKCITLVPLHYSGISREVVMVAAQQRWKELLMVVGQDSLQ